MGDSEEGLSDGRPQESPRRAAGVTGEKTCGRARWRVKIGGKMTGETSRELSNCELK